MAFVLKIAGMAVEVSEPVYETGHLATAWLVPITGGIGGGTRYNDDDSKVTVVNGSDSLLVI